jgi:hypothetical protein
MQRPFIVACVSVGALVFVANARAQAPSLWSPGIVPAPPQLRGTPQPLTRVRTPALQDPPARSRARNALIGGTIGAVSGVVVCTLISTLLINSELDGITTCTTRGNLIFGGGGFVFGATIGALSR